MTLATIGEGIDEGAKIADTAEKGYLKDKVDTGVNTLRDAYTDSLIAARNGQLIPNSPGPTLAAAAAPEVPGGIQAGIQRLQGLAAAQAQNSGKANDTLYTGALNAMAKQMRNQYPGYRDYIDEQIKSVSGVDPANAFYKNLLQDINTGATNAKSEQDKAISFGRENIGLDPHMPAYIEAVRQNLPGAVQNLENAVNKAASDKNRFDIWHRNHEMQQGDIADDTIKAQDQYRQEAVASAYRIQHGVVSIPGLTNPDTMSHLIAMDQNGQQPLSDEQKGMLFSAMQAAQMQYRQEAINIQNGPGKYARRIQDQKTIDSITNGAGQWFDNQVQNIGADKVGSMYANQRRMTSIQSDAETQVASNPDLGAYAKSTMVWTKFGGPNWVNTAQGQFLAKGGLGKFTNFLEDAQQRSQTPDDLRKDGVVKSLQSDIERMQRESANGTAVPQKVYNNLVDNVNTIADPKSPNNIKAEVVKYAFTPKNWGIMDKFGQDFTDDQGIQNKGRNSVFDTMTSPKITDNIWNLKDNEAWGNYKNWTEQSFKTLFGEEVKTMNDIQSDKIFRAKVTWDSDNRRFGVEFPRPTTDAYDPEYNYVNKVKATINRLNSGLSNLSRVQDHEGTDTSAYLLNTMITLGYRPDEKVQGLPQKLMDAIKASHRSNRLEDAYKAAQ